MPKILRINSLGHSDHSMTRKRQLHLNQTLRPRTETSKKESVVTETLSVANESGNVSGILHLLSYNKLSHSARQR